LGYFLKKLATFWAIFEKIWQFFSNRLVTLISSKEIKLTTSPAGHTTGQQQPQQQRRNRAGRVRTVLTEKQLQLLKSCYLANPRPGVKLIKLFSFITDKKA
jgi:hypothetical protein